MRALRAREEPPAEAAADSPALGRRSDILVPGADTGAGLCASGTFGKRNLKRALESSEAQRNVYFCRFQALEKNSYLKESERAPQPDSRQSRQPGSIPGPEAVS